MSLSYNSIHPFECKLNNKEYENHSIISLHSILYFGIQKQLWKSLDEGITWTLIHQHLPISLDKSSTMYSSIPQHQDKDKYPLLCLLNQRELWVSSNQGLHWKKYMDTPLHLTSTPTSNLISITSHSNSPTNLYETYQLYITVQYDLNTYIYYTNDGFNFQSCKGSIPITTIPRQSNSSEQCKLLTHQLISIPQYYFHQENEQKENQSPLETRCFGETCRSDMDLSIEETEETPQRIIYMGIDYKTSIRSWYSSINQGETWTSFPILNNCEHENKHSPTLCTVSKDYLLVLCDSYGRIYTSNTKGASWITQTILPFSSSWNPLSIITLHNGNISLLFFNPTTYVIEVFQHIHGTPYNLWTHQNKKQYPLIELYHLPKQLSQSHSSLQLQIQSIQQTNNLQHIEHKKIHSQIQSLQSQYDSLLQVTEEEQHEYKVLHSQIQSLQSTIQSVIQSILDDHEEEEEQEEHEKHTHSWVDTLSNIITIFIYILIFIQFIH